MTGPAPDPLGPASGEAGRTSIWTGLRWAVACWAVGMAFLWVSQVDYDPLVSAVGPDSYLRLLRVSILWETGDWYDQFVSRINAPLGYEMHWTRPLDVLLFGGALPLTPALGFERALWISGVVLSPLLFLGLYGVLLWAAAPVLEWRGTRTICVVLLCQFAILSHALPARVDQEMFLLVAVLITVGVGLRVLAGTLALRGNVLAGLWGGLAVWLSVELLATVGILLATLVLAWIRDGSQRYRPSLLFALGLLAGILVGVAAEHRPAVWLQPVYDKVSVVHIAIALANLSLWIIAARAPASTWRNRAAFAVVFGGIAGPILVTLFPGLLSNPLLQEYPSLESIWVTKIEEFQPLGPQSAGWGRFLIYLGSAFIALPVSLFSFWRNRDHRGWAPWLFLVAMVVFLFSMSVRHYRFALFYQGISAIPLALLLTQLLPWTKKIGNGYARAAARVLLPLAVLLGPFFIGVFASVASPVESGGAADGVRCDMSSMGRHLEAWHSEPLTFMANLGFGAELVYRTQHRTVGDVTHRNASGIVDTYDFFSAVESDEPQVIAEERRVGAVLVCLDPAERKFFIRDDGLPSLFDRLRLGQAPSWLVPVALPGALGEMFRLYRVQPLTDSTR